jgi:hypothetical protein
MTFISKNIKYIHFQWHGYSNQWCKNGYNRHKISVLHRKMGPAIIYSNGMKLWLKDGNLEKKEYK